MNAVVKVWASPTLLRAFAMISEQREQEAAHKGGGRGRFILLSSRSYCQEQGFLRETGSEQDWASHLVLISLLLLLKKFAWHSYSFYSPVNKLVN